MTAMNEDRFWSIIEGTLVHLDDPEKQLASLTKALSALSVADIEAFELRFGELMEESRTWDLWGAAYVIHGGCGDDSFDYFRHWLISRGRDVYDTALADPESLAKGKLSTVEDVCQFEEFSYVARQVWCEKKGVEVGDGDGDFPFGGATSGEPEGEPFDEDEDELAKRFPRLWRKFGESPLG
ncbi:MAG: DUF4240 domain-containing protein [Hyphomicrobiaceae bacterium]